MDIKAFKMDGLGNDFVIIDNRQKITNLTKDQIIKMFDDRFYRMWEFYLLASKYSFVNMGNVVFQIQIAKNINNLPLTRNYMYN